jgi:hypothetical protein
MMAVRCLGDRELWSANLFPICRIILFRGTDHALPSIDQWTHDHVFLGSRLHQHERRAWFVRIRPILPDSVVPTVNSHPAILMVQSAQDRTTDNASRVFGGARYRRVLVQ